MIGALWLKEEGGELETLLETMEGFAAVLELAGRQLLFFSPESTAGEVSAALEAAGIDYHGVAIASSRFVAEVAAMGGGVHEVKEGERFLAPLGIDPLPVSSETKRKLSLLGLTTMGAVAKLRKKDLVGQFGEEGALLYERVRGRDPSPLQATRRPTPLIDSVDFDATHPGGEAIQQMVLKQVERLFESLKKQNNLCTRIRIRFLLESGRSALGHLQLRSPLDEVSRVEPLIRERIAPLQLPEQIVGIQVGLEGLVADHTEQLDLFEEKGKSELRRLVDLLQVRRSPLSLMKVTWRDPENRLPERRAELEEIVQPQNRRPLCLPTPIQVVTGPAGRPRVVRVREGWQPVALYLQEWELNEEWWTMRPILRSYYRLQLTNGILLRLFRDEETDRWYRQQV